MSAELKMYRLTVDLKIDSRTTAEALGAALSLTMEVAARTAVDISDSSGARVILGLITIAGAESFVANGAQA